MTPVHSVHHDWDNLRLAAAAAVEAADQVQQQTLQLGS
jgi:hypothetical protein